MPPYIPPITNTNSAMIGKAARREIRRSFNGSFGRRGASEGLRYTMPQITSMKKNVQISPGNTPAMNRSAMDCSASTP